VRPDRGHRIVAHPADVGFEAWGPDEPALHDAAVGALADVITGGAVPAAVGARPVAPGGDTDETPTPEQRLMRVLEACLVELDCDDWLAVGVSGGALVGAPLTAEARAVGTHVKAITWHGLQVRRDGEVLRATVILDL
jgi:SHS2 domain-containing protein